jgi:BirA family biotin operon repressor/biotin-[acetyl-CoA-carboxylase] ligase
VAELSLVTGLAAAEVVEETAGRPAAIKWPNDVLLEGRKVAGVLVEAAGRRAILGVGLNVNQTDEELPRDAKMPAGSLLTAGGVRRERAPLLAALLERVELRYDVWRRNGLESLLDALSRRDVLRGRPIVVDGRRGVAVGIDPRGRLVVEFGTVRCVVESGEIDYDR